MSGGLPAPSSAPRLSVVVPVWNDRENLRLCLQALFGSHPGDREVIVVDDGSSDGSAEAARSAGAVVIELPARSGPAAARNRGAEAARAPLVAFVDADVSVHPDTLDRMVAAFDADPSLAALFGSYDDTPAAPNLLSQYKNLFHHFVHQRGHGDATTFWAGCGAIRRSVFLESGGFSRRYHRPSIEDIELGVRLRRAGRKIALLPDIQATHRKRWTFLRLLRSDLLDRAVPWAGLLLREGRIPDALNLRYSQRASALLACAAALALAVLGWSAPLSWGLVLAWYAGIALADRWSETGGRPARALTATLAAAVLVGTLYSLRVGALAVLLPVAALVALNRSFYSFFRRHRGMAFTVGVVLPMHVLYYLYSVLGFALAMLGRLAGGHGARPRDDDGALERA